jgi:hypothetical protein
VLQQTVMPNFAEDVMSEREVFGVTDNIHTVALVEINANISSLRIARADIKNHGYIFLLRGSVDLVKYYMAGI